jgi:hypothetical protein
MSSRRARIEFKISWGIDSNLLLDLSIMPFPAGAKLDWPLASVFQRSGCRFALRKRVKIKNESPDPIQSDRKRL